MVYFRGHRTRPDRALVKARSHARHGATLASLPKIAAASYDLRALGLVGPIKDQGNCGSCWDFSGTDTAEGAFFKAGVLKADGSGTLSTQYTLDCYGNGGCDGDDNTTVLDHAKQVGLPLASAYGPYDAHPERCKQVGTLYKLKDWGFCDGSGNGVTATDTIKSCMVQYGIIGVGVAAGPDWDNVGPNTTITGRGSNIDHDVSLVGWDDSHDNGDGSKGAWICRNNWGTSWANNGYAWIKYGADSIGTEAVFALADPPPAPPTPPVPVPPVPPVPVPPTPVPPVPPVPPAPGPVVSLALTADQVASVIQQSGVVTIRGDMPLTEVIAAFQKAASTKSPKPPCPCDKPRSTLKAIAGAILAGAATGGLIIGGITAHRNGVFVKAQAAASKLLTPAPEANP